jgi:hypothetical protein
MTNAERVRDLCRQIRGIALNYPEGMSSIMATVEDCTRQNTRTEAGITGNVVVGTVTVSLTPYEVAAKSFAERIATPPNAHTPPDSEPKDPAAPRKRGRPRKQRTEG